MSLVTIKVDDEHYKVEDNKLLIDTLIENGIEIPYFCYHKALGVDGNCRMCMVEIEGKKRPQIACDTFVHDGMVIRTQGDKINQTRREILELELINHPVDCPICDQAGECKLQDFYMDYGLYNTHIAQPDKVKHTKHIELGSNVVLDQERCVLCARCTRFTSNVTQTHELGIINRGDHACVSTMPNRKLDNPYAMNVVDLCPVGALTSKDFRFSQRVWFLDSTPSICHGCEKGCSIFIDHNKEKYQEPKIHRFRPRYNEKVNGYFICDYGRLSYKALQKNRLNEPIFQGKVISIEEAKAQLQSMIEEAKDILVVVDANLYLEDMAVINKFAKEMDAVIIAPTQCYYDKSFADEWLRSAYKCANKEGCNDFQFPESIDHSKAFDLVINFNHPDTTPYKAKQSITFATHNIHQANLTLPIATYAEYSGTLINKEGIKQHCTKAVESRIGQVARWLS
ncbi:MAG: 2Fe-2S iron-sulfur cluster-binding protein [Campylobacterota bacterium]|nr:2Fe-2S iron-sulfur cluster-binding protein [Campylobacterota bacterium]